MILHGYKIMLLSDVCDIENILLKDIKYNISQRKIILEISYEN